MVVSFMLVLSQFQTHLATGVELTNQLAENGANGMDGIRSCWQYPSLYSKT